MQEFQDRADDETETSITKRLEDKYIQVILLTVLATFCAKSIANIVRLLYTFWDFYNSYSESITIF